MPTKQTVLLTLGRLPKALDLARGFHALGWRVIVAEPFEWHLARVSRCVDRSYAVPSPVESSDAYLAAMREIVDKEAVSLVVPVSEEIIHASRLVPLLPPDVRMLSMPHANLLTLHDKASFVDVCRSIGLDAPQSAPLGSAAAEELVSAHDVVLKPIFSCSGNGVTFHDKGATLPSVQSAPYLVQQRINGRVLSTFSYAEGGQIVTTVVYCGALFSGTVAVAFRRVEGGSAARVESWVQRFVQATNFSGFISFDFIEDESGRIWGIECNPRATSGLHFVDAKSLAERIAEPHQKLPIANASHGLRMQFYPCLTETQKRMFSRGFFEALKTMLQASDVTWRGSDPLPFLTMTFTSWTIIWKSIKRGVTFGEVATEDIGWYVSDGAPSAAQKAASSKD